METRMYKDYKEARREAQSKADRTGCDYGIEKDIFGHYVVFGLPQVWHRFGHELRCEVVMCMDSSRCSYGHGPLAKK